MRSQYLIEIKFRSFRALVTLCVFIFWSLQRKVLEKKKLEIYKEQSPEKSCVYRREVHKIIKCSEKVSQALLFTPSHNTRPRKYSVNSEIEKQQI